MSTVRSSNVQMKITGADAGNRRIVAKAAGLIVIVFLAGCTVGPKYHVPPTPAPPAYKELTPESQQETDGWKQAQPQDSVIHDKWWEAFNDPELNALEEQVNVNNQNIKEYFENLMEARAVIREAHAQYWPTVTANPSWARQRSSNNLTHSTQANTGQTSTLISFPVDVSWVPDLWGKIRNQVREAQYSAQVSAADLENEQLTEQASLASYYFEIRGQDALQKILDETVQANQKALDVTKAAYETGIDDYISQADDFSEA